jgi:putative spermidine/putrescine transport system permease protein
MTSVPVTPDTIMRAADGTPLKQKLAQAQRAAQMKALALIAPLFLFIVISFLVPIGAMLVNAFYDPDIHDQMPQTVAAIETWDGRSLPDETVFAAFAADMKAAHRAKSSALIGKRLNYEVPTLKSKVTVTARKLDKVEAGPWKEAVIAIDPVWGEPETWATIKRASSTYTPFYLLNVMDLKQTADGQITGVEDNRKIYRDVLWRTLGISFLVTADHPHPRLSRRLHAGHRAAEDGEPADDPCAAAVLDIAAGAHNSLVHPVAGWRRGHAVHVDHRHHLAAQCAWLH